MQLTAPSTTRLSLKLDVSLEWIPDEALASNEALASDTFGNDLEGDKQGKWFAEARASVDSDRSASVRLKWQSENPDRCKAITALNESVGTLLRSSLNPHNPPAL